MKKILLSLLVILMFTVTCFCQETKTKDEIVISHLVSISRIKTLIEDTPPRFTIEVPTKTKLLTLTYEDLPDALIIRYEDNKEDPGGDKKVILTRVQIWRFLQYINHVQPMIDEAWKKEYKIDD